MAASGRRWGWHQLDARWAQRLVADAAIRRGAVVVDIGAGHGALTAPLIDAGARVIAVEAHPDRARYLRRRFGGAVVVVQADAGDLRLPRRPYHVVANPPFAVSSALLRRLLQPGSRLVTAQIVLQEQTARRWVEPGAPGYRRWSRSFVVSLRGRLPRTAFRPPPSVATVVLRIEARHARSEVFPMVRSPRDPWR